ncbi:helix-turn-helix domain-containing protein [Lysinibacillus capsici]|uniref:helix-turn-helix domain-containing protein n=1 Tax=Lysinibacillus capsici TaxID=2115968 RepID=UPI0034E28979
MQIAQAKHMLLGTNDKLQDIALKTGFADGSYLGKTFSKYVHLSPSSFRKRKHTSRIVSIQLKVTCDEWPLLLKDNYIYLSIIFTL